MINTDDINKKQALFGLVFSGMPTYTEILNGTPKLSLMFQLSEDFNKQKSFSVDYTLPIWNQIVQELKQVYIITKADVP